jgi:hypothetical protein
VQGTPRAGLRTCKVKSLLMIRYDYIASRLD